MKQKIFNFEFIKLEKNKFYCKDVFFNNGLVNFYIFCKEHNFDLNFKLTKNYLEFENNDNLFDDIFVSFIKEYKIIFETNNYRWYFNDKTQNFEKAKRYDILEAGNTDIRNTIIYVEPKIENNELLQRLQKFAKKENFDIYKKYDKLNYEPIFSKDNKLKKKKLNKLVSLEEFIYAYKDYIIKNKINMDSKINPFENGKYKTLFSMLSTKSKQVITHWEALIYLVGYKVNKYFLKSNLKINKQDSIKFAIFPNSSNLKSLYLLKKDLKIPNENITYKNNNGKIIDTYSNIDFYNQLSKDEIKQTKFYESKSIKELELKFFMYLFSKIYHIEKEYKDLSEDEELAMLFDEDTFNYSKMLFEALQDITFVTYSYDKNFKYSLDEYTKAYKLLMFFLKLKENELFSYLGELIYQVSISKKKKQIEKKEAYNQNIIKLSDAILNFKDIVPILYNVSYDILQTDEENKKNGLYKRFGFKLYNFLNLYNETIQKGEEVKIHEEAKKLGQQIGDFIAKKKDKDLLFKIRNIKNFKQMIVFLKDVEFALLKEYNENNQNNFYLDTKKVLELLEEDRENWDLIRDYMAIYAIEQYKYKTYNQSNQTNNSNQGDK